MVTGAPRLAVSSICLNQILSFSACVNVEKFGDAMVYCNVCQMESDGIVPQNVPK